MHDLDRLLCNRRQLACHGQIFPMSEQVFGRGGNHIFAGLCRRTNSRDKISRGLAAASRVLSLHGTAKVRR